MTSSMPCVALPEQRARGARRDASRFIQRFPARHRDAVRELAQRHSRLADLAASFPALLFALAVPRPRFDPAVAIARVIAGEGLPCVAEAARVPLWLRALPPEAFARPLPPLPDGDLFRRHIANHIPRSTRLLPRWLETVSLAAMWGPGDFAIWTARELKRDPRSFKFGPLLCLWAWVSTGEDGRARRLADGCAWNMKMQGPAARGLSRRWLERIEPHLALRGQSLIDVWLKRGTVGGYEFVPLRSADEIATEAFVMSNCAATFGFRIAGDGCRLWSMRRDGVRVAMLSIGRQGDDPFVRLTQMARAENASCSADEWRAAREWLNGHGLVQPYAAEPGVYRKLDPACWRELWRPYWLAKRRLPPWLPMVPSRDVLYGLRDREWR